MIDHEPNNRTGFNAGVTAWSLVALSAGFGLIAIASCGIPFVPPASRHAIVFGAMGCLAPVAAVVFAFLRGRTAKITAFEVTGKVGDTFVRRLNVLAGRRLYALEVVSFKPERLNAEDVTPYFESFAIKE